MRFSTYIVSLRTLILHEPLCHTLLPSNEATGEPEDAANNNGIGNINSSLEINKLSMPDSHNEDAANNFNSNMEDYTNLTDAWSRLPETMGDLPYRVHYVF